MGQTVVGVFYGCEVTEDIDLYGEDGGFVERWEEQPVKKRGKLELCVASDENEERQLIGFWVYDMDKVDLKGRCMSFTEIMSSKEAVRAQEAWIKLLAWADDLERAALEEPKFWMAPVEVG